MPPKAAQKPKKESTPPPTPQPKKAKASPVPKKKPTWYGLKRDSDATPVDVTYEESADGKLVKGSYGAQLKLEASTAFSLVKTTIFTEGPYEGMQAILIRPAKPFPFMKLTKEIRTRIYNEYLAPGGVIGNEIVLESKHSKNQTPYAKSYANSSKERVALLAVNREIHDEATPLLYAHTLRFESTSTLLDFLSWADASVKAQLTGIIINTWIKTTARNGISNLAHSTKITSLHIDNGIMAESDAEKAARSFHLDMSKFLEAIGAVKGDKAFGVDVLSFGKRAFVHKDQKDKQGKPVPWSDEVLEEFVDALRAKLKWKFNPDDFNYFSNFE